MANNREKTENGYKCQNREFFKVKMLYSKFFSLNTKIKKAKKFKYM